MKINILPAFWGFVGDLCSFSQDLIGISVSLAIDIKQDFCYNKTNKPVSCLQGLCKVSYNYLKKFPLCKQFGQAGFGE
jgi:hypothetical protein